MSDPVTPSSCNYENYVPEHFNSHLGDRIEEFKIRHGPNLQRMNLQGVGRVLDIGGGSGELSALLALRGLDVTYLDVSEQAATFATGICRSALPPDAFNRIRFMVGDLTQPLDEDLTTALGASYDLIVSINVWEHLAPERCLAMVSNAIRLLRPGGRLHIETGPNRIIADGLRWIANFCFGVSGGYKDQHVHINEQTYWSLKKALASIPEHRFRVLPVHHPRWIYGEARCAAALGRRRLLKAVLPLIWCFSFCMDLITVIPGLRHLLCYGLCAVSRSPVPTRIKL